ncbi:MAG: response regulator [Magnetococcales bacterium]|nr:response regulator [Magnetococcales bacterium]
MYDAPLLKFAEITHDAIVVVDGQSRILFWNTGAETLFGCPRTECLGQPITRWIPERYHNRHQEALAQIKTAPRAIYASQAVTLHGLHRNGQEIPLEATLSAWQEGEACFFAAILRDISGRMAQEELNRLLCQRWRADKEAAEQASRYKSEFLATTSHEVRTPLNGILGMTALLMEKRLSSKKRFYVEMIRKSGEHLLNVLNDVLDLSKVESGHLELEKQPFSLREVRDELRGLFGELATKKGLRLRTRIATEVPFLVEGDVHRIRQILVNLLSNAIKFTEKGNITLRVLSTDDPDDKEIAWIECQVEDTGMGIAPEVAERLFQPFTQGDASTTRKYGGSGLGLAICRRLAERMHGSVTLCNTARKGSLFSFKVPLQKLAVFKEFVPAPVEEKAERVVRKAHILVAEDNVVNQRLFQIVLKNLGVRVTIADTGTVALRLLQEGRYDLVLMDCHMPDMDGVSACQAFRQYEQAQGRPRTPVVAVTANVMLGEKERCLAAGMDDFLTKPVTKGDLQTLLLRYIDAGKPAV